MGIIVIGPLRYYSQACIELFLSRIGVPTESEVCVVDGLAVVPSMVNPSHTLYMPHITLPQQWDSMSIQVLLSLDHCAITYRHGLSYFSLESVY